MVEYNEAFDLVRSNEVQKAWATSPTSPGQPVSLKDVMREEATRQQQSVAPVKPKQTNVPQQQSPQKNLSRGQLLNVVGPTPIFRLLYCTNRLLAACTI